MLQSKSKKAADQRLLPLIEHLARVGRRASEVTLEPGGLRPRPLILLKLLSEKGPASQLALADSLSLDPSNVVGLLNELEERALVTRRRDSADRRRHIVELSGRGRRAAPPPPPPPPRPPPNAENCGAGGGEPRGGP